VAEVAALASGDPGPEQSEAVAALGRIGGPEATKALAGLLASRQGDLRYLAASAMARLPVREGLPPLYAAASREGPARVEALRGMADLLRAAPLGDESPPPPGEVRRLGRGLLSHEDPTLSSSAAYLVGSIRDRGSLRGLRGLLGRKGAPLRAAAVTSLGRLGGGDACESIVEALADDDDGVRAAAAWAAGEARCAAAGPRLADALEKGSSRVAGNAAWALGEIRYHKALPTLRRRLTEGGPVARANSALALATLGDRTSLGTMRARLKQEGSPHVRAAIVEALGRLPEKRSARSLQRLTDMPGLLGVLATDALRAVETEEPLLQTRGSAIFRGRVVDDDGRPRPGLFVTLALPDRRMMIGMTDPCGEVTVPGLPEGHVHLGIGRAPGG
jgi:HEAT repeat protein